MKPTTKIGIVVLGVLAAAGAQGQAMPVLHDGDKVLALDAVQVVAKETVLDLEWAGGGDYVVGTRIEGGPVLADLMRGVKRPSGQVNVFMYERKTRRYTEVFSYQPKEGEMVICEPVVASPFALIHVISPVTDADVIVGVLDLKEIRTRKWKSPSTFRGMRVFLSRKGDCIYSTPFMKLSDPRASSSTIHVDRFSLDGAHTGAFDFEVPGGAPNLRQDQKGDVVIYYRRGDMAVVGTPNFVTGKVEETKVPNSEKEALETDLIVQEMSRSEQMTTGLSGAIFLAKRQKPSGTSFKENEKLLISTHADHALVSPRGDAVLYLYDRAAMIKNIVEISKDDYDKAVEAGLRAEALMKAKMVGLAILMFSSDNDDKVPGRASDLQATLGPYLQDPGIISGFVLTFEGGALADIKDPSNTELGHVDGPGGRAVVYADGHAKWLPDK